ncbi:methyltransferase domain-containing protein [Actinomycetaceae bacterium TAE3-ERU4]|nr:methyltransferase domain-containing protein [Actinomycetaceae bacterium TAE3-ERU4]
MKNAAGLDLFCGVGGFALNLASILGQVYGVEVSKPAISAAKRAANYSGIKNVSFAAGDAGTMLESVCPVLGKKPEAVVVNPPRRGIGTGICEWISRLSPSVVVYSSCNPLSLQKDLSRLEGYRVKQAQLFDMFPHTSHAEVMVLAVKK